MTTHPLLQPMIVTMPLGNGNPGTVPPWLTDPLLPLPDPIGDDPTAGPIDERGQYQPR